MQKHPRTIAWVRDVKAWCLLAITLAITLIGVLWALQSATWTQVSLLSMSSLHVSGSQILTAPSLTRTTRSRWVATARPSDSANCAGVPAYPEIRPENSVANQTPGHPPNPAYRDWHALPGLGPYYDRINGQGCLGTTEEILEWAAKKWGFDQLGYPDLAKAMAVRESGWQQSAKGDYESGTCSWCVPGFPGYDHQSYGILQVKRTSWPGSYPLSAQSTAFSADYAMAGVRYHYDGGSSPWLGDGARGDIRNAVAAYYCGCGYNGAGWYASEVFKYYDAKPWQHPDQMPDTMRYRVRRALMVVVQRLASLWESTSRAGFRAG